MKSPIMALVAAGFALALSLRPTTGWTTRAYVDMVTGEVTAAPLAGEIEIAHHLYHVKPDSAAARALHELYAGQIVQLLLDGPPDNPTALVIAITPQDGLER